MNNKTKLKNRFKKAKMHKFYRKYVERQSNGMITAIYCKGCGAQIQGLNKDNVLTPFWNYRETLIEFDTGTKHMTPMCVKCHNIQDKDALEALYTADLEEFDVDDKVEDSKIWNYYLDRVPKKNKTKTREKEEV